MTLIGTFVAGPFVQQAADRLLSIRGRPHDPLANKTLLFVARDAIVTVGYTGLAKLDGIATDRFIAQCLAEDDGLTGAVIARPPRRGGPMPVGLAALSLADALASAAVPRGAESNRPLVVMAGWKWKTNRGVNRGTKAFVWVIRPDGGTYQIERNPDVPSGGIRLSCVPRGRVAPARADQFFDEVTAIPPGDVDRSSDLIASLIRDTADANAAAGDPTVGRDCMVVTIPAPTRSRTISLRFVPDPLKPTTSGFGSYSPWIISPATVVTPTEISPGWFFSVGSYRVQLSGPRGPKIGFRSTGQ